MFAMLGSIVDVDGRVGSKKPAEFECLRACPLISRGVRVRGDPVRSGEPPVLPVVGV
jgi:hypothetical protein